MEFVIGEEFDGRTVKDLLYQRGVSRGLITRLKGMPDGITLNGEHVTVRCVLGKGRQAQDSRRGYPRGRE